MTGRGSGFGFEQIGLCGVLAEPVHLDPRDQRAGLEDHAEDGEGELLMLVHGQVGRSLAATFKERLQRVGQDFAQQHLADQKLAPEQKRPYTLVVGMRSWLFAAFRDLKREPDRIP